MNKNRGITLIELIIVIAIISILSLGTALSIGLIGYGDAKSATGRITTVLARVRLENMTKKEQYYLVIYQKDNDYYLSIQTDEDSARIIVSEEKLDLKNGNISYEDTEGNLYKVSSDLAEVNVRDELVVTFAKETGGLIGNSLGDEEIVKTIYVECNRIEYKIHLVKETGKYYINE